MPGDGRRSLGWSVGGFLLLLALLAPLSVLGKFQTLEFALVWSIAVAIVGLNLLIGYCGQISLGNSAFMVVGGYTTALLATRQGWAPLATIPVAAVLSAIGGVVVGIPALKLRGLYLGLATFALALSAPSLVRHFDSLTGGSQGIYVSGAGNDPFGLVESGQITSEQWLYYLSLVILVLFYLLTRGLLRSDVGRAFRSIRDGETVAVANGVSLRYYKTLAFAVSAMLAGVAGSLNVMAISYIGPDSFDVGVALALLVAVAIGGLGTQAGPIVGALFYVWIPNYVQEVSRAGPELAFARPDLVYGVLLVLLMYFVPQGAVGSFYRLMAYRGRLRSRVVPAPAGMHASAVAGTMGPAVLGGEDETGSG